MDNSVIGRLVDIRRGIQRPNAMLQEDMAVLHALIERCLQAGAELLRYLDDGRGKTQGLQD